MYSSISKYLSVKHSENGAKMVTSTWLPQIASWASLKKRSMFLIAVPYKVLTLSLIGLDWVMNSSLNNYHGWEDAVLWLTQLESCAHSCSKNGRQEATDTRHWTRKCRQFSTFVLLSEEGRLGNQPDIIYTNGWYQIECGLFQEYIGKDEK